MTQPLALAVKLKNIIDICEAADDAIAEQTLIKKGALDAGKENDGLEPAVVRAILSQRKKKAKNPAEAERVEELAHHYMFLLGDAKYDARPWTQADDEMSRVMALTNTDRPPKIEAIKKALGCSQGKAHKLRTMAAARLATKSSSSPHEDEHEHLAEPAPKPPSIMPAPTVWHEVTVVWQAAEAERKAAREAERERRRAAHAALAAKNAAIDADPLIPPPHLDRRQKVAA